MQSFQFEQFVEDVKAANAIEEVISESGFKLAGHGRYRRGKAHDSLVVDTRKQTYSWNKHREIAQDVISWKMKREGWDFRTALEWLAKRAGMPLPRWGSENEQAVQTRRKREEVFAIAAGVFQRWLMNDTEALEYVTGIRGWSRETVENSGIGFSGRGTTTAYDAMRSEFALYGIDPESPAAVAALGFRGDVAAWGKTWGVDVSGWVEKGRIHGLMNTPGIVYVHSMLGRVRYLSRRQLPGYDRIGSGEKARAWKSFNPPVALVGTRAPYFNWLWTPNAQECVIVEGQADAITFGQWGIPAVALCGVWANDEAMRLYLHRRLRNHNFLYVAMDDDEAGGNASLEIARAFGPMTRIIEWSSEE